MNSQYVTMGCHMAKIETPHFNPRLLVGMALVAIGLALSPQPTHADNPVPGENPFLSSVALAALELDPQKGIIQKANFFTSACYGDGANPVQSEDYLKPGDWGGSRGKCIFGGNVAPESELPTIKYSAGGGEDGLPHFYIIPPGALANEPYGLKQLSEIQLIVDPEQGWDSLGMIGFTADGITYQAPATDFLIPGGTIKSIDGTKTIVMPKNENNVFHPDANGGNYGYQGFPAVIFKDANTFAAWFTGKAGYAPQRIYLEAEVDTLRPEILARSTAEMTDQEISVMAAEYDRLLTGADPKKQIQSLEKEAIMTSSQPIVAFSRQKAAFYFDIPLGTVLSSINWETKPINNIEKEAEKKTFLETNLVLLINGERYEFTGYEDVAHCAFYSTCITGWSALYPIDNAGYRADRYFPNAPLIRDPRIVVIATVPDNGTALEMNVKVNYRNVK